MKRVLVSLEAGGYGHLPGALVIADAEAGCFVRSVEVPRTSPWRGGYARGLVRLEGGDLLVSGEHRILRVRPESLEIVRVYVSPLFEDLHGIVLFQGALLVTAAYRNAVVRLDLRTGQTEDWFTLPDGHTHPNTLCVTEDGTLLLSVHGDRAMGAVWRLYPEPREIVWSHIEGVRLRAPHDGQLHLVAGAPEWIVNESFWGRVIWRDGRTVDTHGWCRGMCHIGQDVIVGVCPFRDDRPPAGVPAPGIVVIRDRQARCFIPFPVPKGLQPFAVIPAMEADLSDLSIG